MIAALNGTLIKKTAGHVIVDIGGVGYHVLIPLSTYLKLGDTGQTVSLHVYTHLSDNSLSLFGFYTEKEKDVFQKLIGISGIGPKLALNILSGIETSDLEEAIRKSDVARISLVPGIGRKTAMRIALELQEKLDLKEKVLQTEETREKQDLISALMNLGFKRKEVEAVINEVVRSNSSEADFEMLLRQSLKKLSKI
ncbi:MAG: Holliday junction branch migration protein RuvA [Candidatus Aminicenantes bacterium]|nr:Holliday junction branch migration protein RuvA [Candidatus Aminicenantes bacterium]